MAETINQTARTDNRNYDYSHAEEGERYEFGIICDFISSGKNVIDLGCGNGSLMKMLREKKNSRCVGIEISESGVTSTRKKGFEAYLARIDGHLPFSNDSFDYAICNVTIQMVMYPEILLQEMKRLAKHLVISFPNFGFYKNRIDLFFHGRMPRPMLFGYQWYSTGHIHQLSLEDFRSLLNEVGGLRIIDHHYEKTGTVWKDFLTNRYPNLFVVRPVYLIERS